MIRRAHRSPLFPYTTLFRSVVVVRVVVDDADSKGLEPVVGRCNRLEHPCDERAVGRVDDLGAVLGDNLRRPPEDRKSTRLNSSHVKISYAVFCLKKKRNTR